MRELKDFPGIDHNAPRYIPERLDVIKTYGSVRGDYATFFQKIKAQHPQLAKYSMAQIRKILREFNKLIADAIVENVDGVHLPERCGHIMVVSTKVKHNRIVDRKMSSDTGKYVYYNNAHTEDFMPSILFTTCYRKEFTGTPSHPSHMFENWKYWSFTGCQELKRKVSIAFRNDWKKYRPTPYIKSITRFVEKERINNYYNRKKDKMKETYNEFNL